MTGCQPVRQALKLVPLVVIFGILYGAVMGSFGGIWGERFLQLLYSSAKVPVLLMSMFLLSLPSFYVVNTLMVCDRISPMRCAPWSRPRPA